MEEELPVTSKNVFREDVVRHTKRSDRIGIVLQNGNDSESSSEYEDEEDRIEEGHVLVSWYPKGHEEEIEEKYLRVVDRSLLHGDIVRWADPSKGSMKGYISKVGLRVNVRVVGSNQYLLKDVHVDDLIPLQKFYRGLSIALGAWIGVVHEVLLRLTLKLRNGARCIVEGEQINMLVDNTDQRDEDSPFYCQLFYPGQSLAGTSRVFRDVQWINGPRPVFSGSQRITCIVEEVVITGLQVHWQQRGYNTDATESLLTPPDTLIAEEKIPSVTTFDSFNKASIQIGDKAFYILTERDIQSIKNPPAKVATDDAEQCSKEQPENKKSKQSSRDKNLALEEAVDEKYEDNDSSSSEESADDEDSDHGNARASRPSAPVSSRRNETRHQAAAVAPRTHATRKRRQFRRKKKKHQVLVRLIDGERVCVEVEATSKLLTVKWQDGSKEENISSTDLLPVLHVDDLEFFPGDFVIDKTSPPSQADYGVVQRADCAQRTCSVKWMNRTENDYDERVSVYDIGDHPDYSFRSGDVVVRLTEESDAKNEEGEKSATTSSCGQVLSVDNSGMVNILWADQTSSAMLPQNIVVVHTEDWSSTGSPHSSSDEEWETTSDVSTDPERPFEALNPLNDMQILDDIAQRSLAALSSNNQSGENDANQEAEPQNEFADTQEELGKLEPDSGEEEDEQRSEATVNDKDIKVRPSVNPNFGSAQTYDSFSVMEDIPPSHRYSSSTFQPSNQRQFNSAIRKEISAMKSHLPDGVFVKGFESRLDLYSILIKGPAGTPYEDGVFAFDLQLPPDYPKSPPNVQYLSQCSERLNPNLYEDGTVCVSLLGTWNGKGSETWTSKSNLCQLILSLQGLILCEEPYFNEAGYEKHKNSSEGAENSRMYNEMVFIKLLQSLDRLVNDPPETFKIEIMEHMKIHLPRLFHRIYSWLSLHAPKDFIKKHALRTEMDGCVSNPGFPLLPLSFGFCITLLRNLKALERTAENHNI